MEYRRLGSTGVKVSVLCLGTARFGEATDEAEAIRLVHRALDAGINFIDTANAYQRGVSESFLGKALAGGRREKVVLATKVHHRVGDDVNDAGNSRRHIFQQIEASLRRLQTDYVDVYYLHRPDPDTPQEEELMALDDLIRQGKVRYAGTSHYPAWQLARARWIADVRHLHPVVVEQPAYNLLRREVEAEVMPCAQALGVGLVPHSPLAQGILSGKYRGGHIPPDARAARAERLRQAAREAEPVVERLWQVAEGRGRSPDQVAIRWVLQKPAVCATVIGPRTVGQLEQNLGAVGWALSDEEMAQLDEVSALRRPGG